jgi:hypothetical protein
MASFGYLPMLRELNLSSNRLTKIDEGDFPRFVGLTTLDISHNNIQSMNSLAMAATLTRNCTADVTFLDQGNPACPCNLLHRNQTCNIVLCSCEPSPPLAVSCDMLSGSESALTIPAYQLCDGIVDCPDCADERLCDVPFYMDQADIRTCMGDPAYLRLRNGAGYLRPQPGFQQSACALVPHTEAVGFPVDPLVQTSPVLWTFRSDIDGSLSYTLTTQFVDSRTIVATMQLDGFHEGVPIRIPLPKDCPIKVDIPPSQEPDFPLAVTIAGACGVFVLLFCCLVGRSMRRRVKLAKVAHASQNKELELTINRLLTDFGHGIEVGGERDDSW